MGAIQRQNQFAVFQPQHDHHQLRNHITIQPDALKEPLQTAVIRLVKSTPRKMAGQMAEITLRETARPVSKTQNVTRRDLLKSKCGHSVVPREVISAFGIGRVLKIYTRNRTQIASQHKSVVYCG